jgi:hypothetical protein
MYYVAAPAIFYWATGLLTSQKLAQIDILEFCANSGSLKIGLEAMNLPDLALFSYTYQAASQ